MDSITVDDKLFHLSDSAHSESLTMVLRVLEAIPKDAFQSVPVHVSVEQTDEEKSLYTMALLYALDSAFPDLVELSLPPEYGYLRWLSGDPYTVEPGAPPRFLLPNLKRLTLYGNVPSTKMLRLAVKIAATRKVEHLVNGHRARPAPIEVIRVAPRTPYDTPCYRRVLKEAQGVVSIKCDAPWRLAEVPEARSFFRLHWDQGPLYPPDDGMRWVDEVVDEVQVVEPEKYSVSTSDEEEREWE